MSEFVWPVDIRAHIVDRLEPHHVQGDRTVLAEPWNSDIKLNPGGKPFMPPMEELRQAAVLVPLVDRPGGMTVLLTIRTDHLSSHAGQVAFPGGRIDDGDTGPVDAALRETEEEVGIHRSHVNVVSLLDGYSTGSGYHITPVVGFVEPGFDLTAHEHEVAEIFEVPLRHVLDPANHEQRSQVFRGAMRHYYAVPYDDYNIWGATAGMLVNLSEKLFLL